MTSKRSIPKIQIIPQRNEGVIVFSKNAHNEANNPVVPTYCVVFPAGNGIIK